MTTKLVGDSILYFATAGAVLGLVLYISAPWHRTTFGRHAIAMSVVVSATLVLLTIRNSVGEFPSYDIIRLVVWAFGAIVIWWRTWIIAESRWLDRQYKIALRRRANERERTERETGGGSASSPDLDSSAD